MFARFHKRGQMVHVVAAIQGWEHLWFWWGKLIIWDIHIQWWWLMRYSKRIRFRLRVIPPMIKSWYWLDLCRKVCSLRPLSRTPRHDYPLVNNRQTCDRPAIRISYTQYFLGISILQLKIYPRRSLIIMHDGFCVAAPFRWYIFVYLSRTADALSRIKYKVLVLSLGDWQLAFGI